MKKIFLLLLSVAGFLVADAQVNIDHQAISNAGEFYSGSWGSLSVNIAGEPVLETISGGNVLITQGFEQPEFKTVGIISLPANAPQINLFPNPATNKVNIAFDLTNAGKLSFRMFDMAGRELAGFTKGSQLGQQTETINLDGISQGLYMLNIVFEAADPTKSFSVVKRFEVIK
ncbi:MAG: T9SS type A sorting domain-containing protein [Sphingobacteriales bacterium JAD_PAG50586_3]|nr:MAG: T9SS type A sorting domain-containing protein [Sphingobacteriales bacterium JAD_PAG50586_3]